MAVRKFQNIGRGGIICVQKLGNAKKTIFYPLRNLEKPKKIVGVFANFTAIKNLKSNEKAGG